MVRLLYRSLVLFAVDKLTSERRYPDARQILERAGPLLPDDLEVQRALMRTLFDLADWPPAEAAARRILSAVPTDHDGRTILALAVAGQGNDREALRAIYSALEVVSSGGAEANLRQLRDQIERRLWATSGCDNSQLPDPSRGGEATQRLERFLVLVSSCVGAGGSDRLSHFSVTYQREGRTLAESDAIRIAAIESVKQDILGLLERQYSSLAIALDHQMTRRIPVVLLVDAEYRLTTGAPLWAGGQYDNDDATITYPISLEDRLEFVDKPEDMAWWEEVKRDYRERILIHETAHAFIDDMSKGLAPRDIQEGLAQWFEREVTKDHTPLSVTLAERVKERARRDASSQEAAQQIEASTLAQIFLEIRTAGSRHAGSLVSVYTGGQLFVEYLLGQRGIGGMREVLGAMAQERNVDVAFERIYGRSYDGTRRAWLDRLRSEWGVMGDLRQ